MAGARGATSSRARKRLGQPMPNQGLVQKSSNMRSMSRSTRASSEKGLQGATSRLSFSFIFSLDMVFSSFLFIFPDESCLLYLFKYHACHVVHETQHFYYKFPGNIGLNRTFKPMG